MRHLWIAIFAFLLTGVTPEAESRETSPTRRSVCLLKSEQGSGSGFFAFWNGRNVLITNNHVILGMPGVRILDVNGRDYRYDTVHTSPDRDLAFIPLERDNLDDMPNLRFHPSPDRIATKAQVTAYGDSLGDGVIVETEGKYLGIGPDVLEVSAPFVPGNSGGPIVVDRTGEVIGVATYCRIIASPRAANVGSRFEAKYLQPSVRRFATRIDNLDPSGFETVSRQQISEDQAAYLRIEEAYRELMRMHDFYEVQSYLRKHRFTMPDKWHTTYLRKEADQKLRFIDALRKIVLPHQAKDMPENDELFRSIRAAWTAERPKMAEKTRPALIRKCILCSGYGKMRVDLPREEYEKHLRASFRMEPCTLCRQKGKITIRPERKYLVVTGKFSEDLAKAVKPEPKEFCGFRIGAPVKAMAKIHQGFYRKGWFVRDGVFTIWKFNGNHQIAEAAETRLWFVGSLLMRVDLILPVKNREAVQTICDDLGREFAGLSQAEIRTAAICRAARNFDLSGKTADADNSARLRRIGEGSTFPGDHAENSRLPAAARYIGDLKAAAAGDPFGSFFRASRRDADGQEAEGGPEFLRITFQHKGFNTCAGLMSILPRKSISFSSGNAEDAGQLKR